MNFKRAARMAAAMCALTAVLLPRQQAFAEEEANPPTVTVTVDSDVISVDGMRTSLKGFPKFIAAKREAFEKVGHNLNEVEVIIRARKDTPAGTIQQLIKTLQDNKFEKFALRVKKKPSLRIHLQANDDGSLKSMRVGRRPIKDFAALTEHVKKLVSDDAMDEVELAVDEKLAYKVVIQCVAAVSGYRNEDGELVTLINNIKFSTSAKKSAAKKSPAKSD